MAVCFCDSSAIVKRYVDEAGTAWLVSSTDPAAGNRVYVAGITGVEVVAAIARKERNGDLSSTDAAAAIARFRHDYTYEFRVVAVSQILVAMAMTLAETHALRGYDALQLAAAVIVQRRRRARALPPITLLSSDRDLNTAGAAEGLATDDPSIH